MTFNKPVTIPSTRFDAEGGRALKAADGGPVIITEAGAPAYVMMPMAEYRRLKGEEGEAPEAEPPKSFASRLAMPGIEDIELDIPPRLHEEGRPNPFAGD
ncbi:prevent-host-death family protein [Rhizobium sp. RU20A]|uniref:type II toxin-antitoxin system prevent-host-death family antitoxin n=1 Tax=Rhizobium sp. RU20A TaxID=1907412 RepID=UPI000954B0EC|nr:type II toxin-antitoxin system prevent-host-death family antitoxin [Rhizobium sp. RU20A]SIQ28597.1 prevent-host-death family protein [Rhizobium sp. RU20A]